MVSQFEILPNYTQINYQGRPGAGDQPWPTGTSSSGLPTAPTGLPAYLVIDMVTQEAEVVRLEEGMKYTTAEHFGRNLYRHLRFHYPTMMFDDPVFEIDEEGTPYWVCPRMVKTIGLFGGTDIQGAVLVNAVTGESQYYEDVPTWVDRVYSSRHHHGAVRLLRPCITTASSTPIWGQRDVTLTTDGWNYIAIDDDVYMYTGVTSVTSDQSNIGFILTNQRTKETRFYSLRRCHGDLRHRLSAQSQVQQMRYYRYLPPAAEHCRPAHLFHGPQGRGRSGEDVCHGERPAVQHRGNRPAPWRTARKTTGKPC